MPPRPSFTTSASPEDGYLEVMGGPSLSSVTAINLLIEPDEATRARARDLNARLRRTMPEGFALDGTHAPHITVLQRYVRTPELEQVLGAVGEVVAGADLAALTLRAAAISHAEWDTPGTGMASLLLGRDPRLLELQGRLIAAVAPFASPDGTGAAFVTDPEEPAVNATTIGYVAHFVPDHCCSSYEAHLSIGTGTARRSGSHRGRAVQAVRREGGGRRRLPAREQRHGSATASGVAGGRPALSHRGRT